MARVWILLWLMVGSVAAQEPGWKVYIGLTGAWKVAPGDNPAWAAADFDDSGWAEMNVPLPYDRSGSGREMWLRKTVALPAGLADGTPLTATIGTIRFAGYELFLNGVKTEPTPAWDRTEFEVPRPRQFEFRVKGTRLVLALRLVEYPRLPAAWLSMEPGPWVVTSADIAPRREGLHVLAWQRVHRVGDLSQSLVLLSFAAIVLVIWVRQREQREFLWLGLYMTLVAVGRTNLFFQIGPDAVTGWRFASRLLLGILPMPFLAMFVAAWTRQRWLVWPSWILAGVGAVAADNALVAMFRVGWVLDGLLLVALGRHMVKKQGEDRYLVPLLVLVIYTHASSWLGLRDVGLPALVQTNTSGWISMGFVWHVIFTIVLGLVFTLCRVPRYSESILRLAQNWPKTALVRFSQAE